MDRDFIKKSLSIYQDEGGVTPFGAKCNIYTGNLNQSLPLRNDFKQKDPEKQEEKTTWQIGFHHGAVVVIVNHALIMKVK